MGDAEIAGLDIARLNMKGKLAKWQGKCKLTDHAPDRTLADGWSELRTHSAFAHDRSSSEVGPTVWVKKIPPEILFSPNG